MSRIIRPSSTSSETFGPITLTLLATLTPAAAPSKRITPGVYVSQTQGWRAHPCFRTGVRTKMGALQDGYNSLLRYVKNNFFDGPRQVSLFAVRSQSFKRAHIFPTGWIRFDHGCLATAEDFTFVLSRSEAPSCSMCRSFFLESTTTIPDEFSSDRPLMLS